ncbi:hypothetical protein B296_00024427, partial [Ensete ventricosum]
AHPGQSPLATWLREAAPCGLATGGRHLRVPPCNLLLCERPAMGGCRSYGLAAARHARRRRPCELLPLRAAAPWGLALVATWSWVADPAWGLAVADRPSSSLPSLQKCSKNA